MIFISLNGNLHRQSEDMGHHLQKYQAPGIKNENQDHGTYSNIKEKEVTVGTKYNY